MSRPVNHYKRTHQSPAHVTTLIDVTWGWDITVSGRNI